MKLTLVFLISLLAYGQDAKVAPKAEPAPAPSERALTKEESLALQLTQARVLHLQEKFKLSQYNEEAQPIISEQQAVFMAACKSVGIPDDKIATECRINTGVDAEGKPVLGPDGKQLAPRVWREVAK